MKTSCQWLSDFLGHAPDPDQAGEALTMGGYPVEEIDRLPDDSVMEVEITSNRPDLLSHVGVARELAALLKLPFKAEFPAPAESGEPAEQFVSVQIDDPDLCPHYTARVMRGVKIGPSPEWMQKRLKAVGLRPINNVVDVTNYVLFEMGQPLHAFDFARIRGNRIVVRRATPGEKLITLDGHERELSTDTLCICDAERPVALAGVMGGEESEVTGGTTDILLESARFAPLSIRNTARRLRMSSDSSYRFERGLDPTLALRASARAAQLILETAGGTLCRGVVEAGSGTVGPKVLTLRMTTLRRLLGVELPLNEVADALARLGLQPAIEPSPTPTSATAPDRQIRVTVPSHRLDLSIEADLIEEAARVVGYDKIPTRESINVIVQPADPALQAVDVMRDMLVAGGYFEALTFSFVSDPLKEKFLPQGGKLRRVDPNVRRADGHLRPSLLPGLLESLRYNESVGNGTVHLFETGSAFWREKEGPVERRFLSFAGGESYAQTRGMVEQLLAAMDATRPVRVVPANKPGFGEFACGEVIWGDQRVGAVGKIDRAIAEGLDLRHLPAAAELEIDRLIAAYQPVPTLRPLPRFPAVRRDVSFVVEKNTRFDRIAEIVEELNVPALEAVEHKTTYTGKPLPADQKSVTITLVFRSEEGTLVGEQVDEQVKRVTEATGEKLGAVVRT